MYEEYTDKQIVEMLKPKLEKLGWGDIDYLPETRKMIAAIYRSGYIRGQLGRSFIIGKERRKKIKWIPATRNNVYAGVKVRYVGFLHENYPECYPAKNIIGEVIGIIDPAGCIIQWPKGSTSLDDCWKAAWKELEVLVCE